MFDGKWRIWRKMRWWEKWEKGIRKRKRKRKIYLFKFSFLCRGAAWRHFKRKSSKRPIAIFLIHDIRKIKIDEMEEWVLFLFLFFSFFFKCIYTSFLEFFEKGLGQEGKKKKKRTKIRMLCVAMIRRSIVTSITRSLSLFLLVPLFPISSLFSFVPFLPSLFPFPLLPSFLFFSLSLSLFMSSQ